MRRPGVAEHAARCALEQGNRDDALEIRDLPRQRRLRETQLLGRAPEAPRLDDGAEVAQVPQLQHLRGGDTIWHRLP